MQYRDETLRFLAEYTRSDQATRLFERLRDASAALSPFASFPELLLFLRNPKLPKEPKNEALRALIEAQHAEDVFPMLMLALLPVLLRIFHYERRFSRDPEELWGELLVTFRQVVEEFPARPTRAVASSLKWRTLGHLQKFRESERRLEATQQSLIKEVEGWRQGGWSEPYEVLSTFLAEAGALEERPSKLELFEADSLLRAWEVAGLISAEESLIILYLFIYRRPHAEVARVLHLSQEALRQRKHRVLERLQGIDALDVTPKAFLPLSRKKGKGR